MAVRPDHLEAMERATIDKQYSRKTEGVASET
jgi:hypothetical protein